VPPQIAASPVPFPAFHRLQIMLHTLTCRLPCSASSLLLLEVCCGVIERFEADSGFSRGDDTKISLYFVECGRHCVSVQSPAGVQQAKRARLAAPIC
jgi:hypothetical protein